ncbi:MAG: YdcF family protein [Deltaproteobacteria bacterium]|nr:YdcF family protein [Deltaproteobacteria bacterium]
MAFLVYGSAGSAPVANFLIWGLERSVQSDNSTISASDNITTVVMLCGGVFSDEDRPIADRLTPSTRLRILKVRELCRDNPTIKQLVIVGGCTRPTGCPSSEAQMSYSWLKEVGLPNNVEVFLEENSRDTEENIRAVSEIMGQAPFYLVTSAAHIPRVLLIAKDMDRISGVYGIFGLIPTILENPTLHVTNTSGLHGSALSIISIRFSTFNSFSLFTENGRGA